MVRQCKLQYRTSPDRFMGVHAMSVDCCHRMSTSTYSPTSGSRVWLIRDTTCKMTSTLINTPLEKLNDQNYRSWKYNTKMMLIERELWKYVTEPAPDEEASRTIFNMKQEKRWL
ncbi:hypothetical protein LAZ67_5003393 [Cordylochernes scorpioides]|uniref:DUF4219 domain-containing protein n=1 Tax=Cordylochernes scorpioides TaxID=51811 RepID=A0ABY6KKT2_9ARAC|nr:hypothetical protein LAZ67_5003393 [Cordylochernes scorpioides]